MQADHESTSLQGQDFSLHQNVDTGSKNYQPPVDYNGFQGSSVRGEAAEAWKWSLTSI
jgi:hypothetical protein